MSDRTTGSGDGRHPTGRFAPRPDEEWAPEDAVAEERPARRPLPGERLPGERLPGEPAPDRPSAGTGAGDTAPQARTRRLPGSVAPGTEGLTGDDRAPEDTARPGPTAGGASRPGTEDLGTGGDGARAGIRERSMGAGGEEHLGRSAPGGPATAEDDMPDDGLGVPTAGQVTGREAATDVWPAAPAGPCSGAAESESGPSGHGAPLLPHDETDRWEQRIRQVSAAFVDEPWAAVEQADRALEEIAARFDEAVARRRRTLRMAWEGEEGRTTDAGNDTEQLRLALRDYRELAGRLLHL